MNHSSQPTPPVTYTLFVLLKALPAWLQLPRSQRQLIAQSALGQALSEGGLSFRFFDAEAFHARISDIACFETHDLERYYFAMERLRDSPLFSAPYFELQDIVPAIEQGHTRFEAHAAAMPGEAHSADRNN